MGDLFWYFAYGWTLDKNLMKKSVGRWVEERRAELPGFSLKFNCYSASWRGGVANLVEDESGIVYGVIYRLDEEQLKKLDRLVGVPEIFARRRVKVRAEELGEVDAVTYVAVSPRRGLVQPSRQYLSAMIRGLKQHGFGENVIRLVEEAAKP